MNLAPMPSRLVIAADRRYLKILAAICRVKMRLSGNKYPSSHPYISTDSFRAIADHIYEKGTHGFDPSAVRTGDMVMVDNDVMGEYLQTINPGISARYVLMGFNDDTNIDSGIASLIDDKIFRFYAQDVVCEHPKIIPVPFGIESLRFCAAGLTGIYDGLRRHIARHPPMRRNRIFFKFNLRTNPTERGKAAEYLGNHPLADTTEYKLSPRLHARMLTGYKFVASPPGATEESSRTWEALYLRTVPIVKDSPAMRSFKALGLPIWIISDWSELDSLTESDLARKYDELIGHANWRALELDFWTAKIRKDQDSLRGNKVAND